MTLKLMQENHEMSLEHLVKLKRKCSKIKEYVKRAQKST